MLGEVDDGVLFGWELDEFLSGSVSRRIVQKIQEHDFVIVWL